MSPNMNYYGRASRAEEQGNLVSAAADYAMVGLEGLIREEFTPSRRIRVSLAHLLQSVSCDVRADNFDRAEGVFEICKPNLRRIQEGCGDDVLEALMEEWLGDGSLMLGKGCAVDHYTQASKVYERVDVTHENWGFEEEFDYAYWAFESYIESEGFTLPDDSDYNFVKKIHAKLDFTGELA